MKWSSFPFRAKLAIAFAAAVTAAAAETVPVRSGEHEGFTRLAIDLGGPTEWDFGRTPAGYELRVRGDGIVFDLADVFARIPRTRLAELAPGDGAGSLALGVTCDCYATASGIDSGSVIIDIRSGQAPEGSPFERPIAEKDGDAAASTVPLAHPRSGASAAARGVSLGATLTYRPNQNLDASLPIYWRDVATVPAGAGIAARSGRSSGQADREASPDPAPLASDAARTDSPALHDRLPVAPMFPGGTGPADRLGLPDLPKPETAEAERELLLQLGRAATQGLIVLELGTADPVQGASEASRPADVAKAAEPAQPEEASGTSAAGEAVHIETAIDRDARANPMALHVNADGQVCVPDEALAIAEWGGSGPAPEQIAAARAGLVGEFDRPDPAAVERLARLYLHLGLGAEARQVLAAFDVEIPDAALLHDIARVLDGLPVPETSALPAMSNCDTAAAMWALMAAARLPAAVDTGAAVRTFSALPATLRRHLGLPLADRLFAFGDDEAARNVRNAMMRASVADDREVAMVAAEIELAGEETAAAEAALAEISAGNDALSTRASKRSIESRLDRGEPVGTRLIETAAALAFEHRSDPLGPEFAHLEIVARSADGDFPGAFESYRRWRDEAPEADSKPTAREVVARLTANADDMTFLSFYFGQPDLIDDAGADPLLRLGLARRLNDLGFAPEAETVLAGDAALADEGRLELARAALLLFDPERALKALATTDGESADRLRADALGMLGRHDEAEAVLSSVGEVDGSHESTSRAGRPDVVALDAEHTRRALQAAEDAGAAAQPEAESPASLEASRSALEQSAALRTALGALLGTPEAAAPDAETN